MTMLDPTIAALSHWHAADAAHQTCLERAPGKWPHDLVRAEDVANRSTWAARDRALENLYATCPTTLAGLSALVTVYCEEDLDTILDDTIASRGLCTILRSIQHLAVNEALGELCGRVTPQAPERHQASAA